MFYIDRLSWSLTICCIYNVAIVILKLNGEMLLKWPSGDELCVFMSAENADFLFK